MIPPKADLVSKTKGFYGQKLGPEADEYLFALFGAVTDGWKKWQDSLKFGQLQVKGAGVGAWSGSGSGGVMSGSPFEMPSFKFKANSPQQVKYTKGLADALKTKFTAFPSSFKFTSVAFTGTSGAAPNAPGPVSAQNAVVPLMTCGSGTNPSGMADLWIASLTKPDFDLTNPAAKSGDLVKAICKAIEQSFQTVWLSTTKIQGNALQTTGANGGVVSGFMTPLSGKLV